MLLILFAALCSVSVSILLKHYKQKKFDLLQMLGFNYMSASILSLLWFKPDIQHFDIQHSWGLIIVLGVLLPSVFWCLSRSLQQAGLIQTEIAQRISVVLTMIISSLIYQEQFSNLKVAALLLGVIAMLLLLFSPTTGSKTWPFSLLGVWLGYAVIDLLFKYTSSLGLKFASTLTAIFIFAALLMLVVNLLRKTVWHSPSILAGLGLGFFNFANIAFYLQAHQQLKNSPALVFASMNILVVVIGVGTAIVLFKEKITLQKGIGAMCALIAIYGLMHTM